MQRQKERAYTEYLVMRAKTGDRSGYNLLAEHYERRLLSFAMRLTGDVEMARDASQEAWLDITRGLTRLSNARLFQAWAYKIVSRRALIKSAKRSDAAKQMQPMPPSLGKRRQRVKLRNSIQTATEF